MTYETTIIENAGLDERVQGMVQNLVLQGAGDTSIAIAIFNAAGVLSAAKTTAEGYRDIDVIVAEFRTLVERNLELMQSAEAGA